MSSDGKLTRAVLMDVDGVVSPVHPRVGAWGDEVHAGDVFGPVMISPTLCEHLDMLSTLPGVAWLWVSSWTPQMRTGVSPFPGRDWASLSHPLTAHTGWWKLEATAAWLEQNPQVDAIAWFDDHLSGGRPSSVHRRLRDLNVTTMLVRPTTDVGLTPRHVRVLENWIHAGLIC